MTATTPMPEKEKFTMDLCAEHLEEAAFLYAQCQGILIHLSAPWPNAHEFENRLHAHLAAILIEGDAGLDTCRTRTSSMDAGELYVAARVFRRNNRPDLIGQILESLSPYNEISAQALSK